MIERIEEAEVPQAPSVQSFRPLNQAFEGLFYARQRNRMGYTSPRGRAKPACGTRQHRFGMVAVASPRASARSRLWDGPARAVARRARAIRECGRSVGNRTRHSRESGAEGKAAG